MAEAKNTSKTGTSTKVEPKYKLPELPKVDINTLTTEQLEFYNQEKALIEQCIELAKKLDVDGNYIPLASEEPAYDRLMGTDTVARAVVVRDPSKGKTPTKILRHPPGRRLYWSTPALREQTGWDELHPVQYNDPIGREIEKYISEVPEMLRGSQKREGYIRRGDAVLAWVDEGIYVARQNEREDKSYSRIRDAAAHENINLSAGRAHTIGEGLQDEVRPRQGFVPGNKSGRDAAADAESPVTPNRGETRRRILPGAGDTF